MSKKIFHKFFLSIFVTSLITITLSFCSRSEPKIIPSPYERAMEAQAAADELPADDPARFEWNLKLPSLAESFSRYFLFGNIWSNQNRMTAFNTNDAFIHHFNSVTAENDHKVSSIANNQGTWNFNNADRIVNWADTNNIAMVGHTLVWHSQSPAWLTTVRGSTEPLTRSEAIENMETHIRNVAGRYAGRFYSWDVLNEAIWGAGEMEWRTTPDWKSHLRSAGRGLDAQNQSQWYDAFANGAVGDECGSDYIYYAFRFARIYDPFAILYYNDYNDQVPGKREAIAQMVIQINERWTDDPLYDGRLLIEGIGMQAHYSITGWMTEPAHVRTAIQLYASTGARISITEWDLTIGGNRENPPTATPALFETQAARFGVLMGIYLEFSDFIERVSFWGKTDIQSWISWGHPLLFDRNYQAKPGYFSILEALESAPPPNISVPVITTDGVYNAFLNGHYAFQLQASQNNFAPILWTITEGTLPPGLRLIGRTGVILGMPAAAGVYTFTAEAANALGSSRQSFTLTVQ